MEAVYKQETREKTSLIEEFNLITQNKDHNIAINVLEMCQYDLNKAVSFYLENGSETFSNSNASRSNLPNYENLQPSNIPLDPIFSMNNSHSIPFQNAQNHDLQMVNEYKKFYRLKENYGFDYSVLLSYPSNILKGIYNKIVPISIRGETPGGEEFVSYLSRKDKNLLQHLNFEYGDVVENIKKASESQQILLVYVHKENCHSENHFFDLMKNNQFKQFCNMNFRILGLLESRREAQELFKKFPEAKAPGFCLFRFNFIETPTLIESFELNLEEGFEFYKKRLLDIKKSVAEIIKIEERIKEKAIREIHQEYQQSLGYHNNPNQFWFNNDEMFYNNFGNNAYQQQELAANRYKIEQDRRLKEKQDEEYKLAQIKAQEQNRKKSEEERKQKEIIEKKQKEEEEKINILMIEKEKIQKKRLTLPEEPSMTAENIITIQFRLPNGAKLSRRFSKNYNIQILYDFVECQESLPFNQTSPFDIIRNIPQLNLSDKKTKKISDVFEDDQEQLHVREI